MAKISSLTFSPVVGCLVKKGLKKGGHEHPRTPPWLRLCSLRMNRIYGAISLPGNEKHTYPDEVCVGITTSVGK